MSKAQVGTKVEAYKGNCVGIVIQSTEWRGEIVKVNRKSIRVRLDESTSKFGRKVTGHWENLNTEKSYRFVKTLSDGRSLYRSESDIYGCITL